MCVKILKRRWFRPKVFGWGFCPLTWEGWLYTIIIFRMLYYFTRERMILPISILLLHLIGAGYSINKKEFRFHLFD